MTTEEIQKIRNNDLLADSHIFIRTITLNLCDEVERLQKALKATQLSLGQVIGQNEEEAKILTQIQTLIHKTLSTSPRASPAAKRNNKSLRQGPEGM